jgi:CheY-like chemotaxis protein
MLSPFRLESVDPASILFVDPGADAFLPVVRRHFEVTVVASAAQALRSLKLFEPTLVITELALPDGDGVGLCRQVKAGAAGATLVLATTSEPARVPEAIKAGCDGVLMKPFPPNLLYTRVGRLLRINDGTNYVCHDAVCPSCGRGDGVGFDAASHRRMWYACLPCGHVWVARHHHGVLKSRWTAAVLDQQRLPA